MGKSAKFKSSKKAKDCEVNAKASGANNTLSGSKGQSISPQQSGGDQGVEEKKGFLSNLSPEEQALEMQKAAKRQENAEKAQRKQLEENRRRKEELDAWERVHRKQESEDKKYWNKLLEQSKREGVVEAKWSEESQCMYVEIKTNWWKPGDEEKTWKQVSQDYYCTLCDKQCNTATLGAHLQSANHIKNANFTYGRQSAHPCGAQAASALPVAGIGVDDPEENLPPWKEWDTEYGRYRCKACNKLADQWHEGTADHKKRVDFFLWALEESEETEAHAAPAESKRAAITPTSNRSPIPTPSRATNARAHAKAAPAGLFVVDERHNIHSPQGTRFVEPEEQPQPLEA